MLYCLLHIGRYVYAGNSIFTEQPLGVFTLKNSIHQAYPYKFETASVRKFNSSLIYVTLFANSEIGLAGRLLMLIHTICMFEQKYFPAMHGKFHKLFNLFNVHIGNDWQSNIDSEIKQIRSIHPGRRQSVFPLLRVHPEQLRMLITNIP